MQWETLFATISNYINDLPIARVSKTPDSVWDLITPNRLMLGRNQFRSLEGWIDLTKGQDCAELLRRNQQIISTWYSLFLDRLHYLIPRPSKWQKTDVVNIGDTVMFLYSETPGTKVDKWKIGVISAIPNPNKLEITYVINPYRPGIPTKTTTHRSPRNVSVIVPASDLPTNSSEYLERITAGCVQ